MRHEDFDNCYKLANDLYTKAKAQGKMPVMLQLKGFKGHTELADPRWQELPPYVWHHYVVVLPNKEGVPTTVYDPTAGQFGLSKTEYSVGELGRMWETVIKIK
jgi:hypothetical protein